MTLRAVAAVAMALVAPGGPMSAASQVAGPSRSVLAIHWGPEDFPGAATMDAAIQEALLSPADPPVRYYAEYLETEEFPSEAASLAFWQYLQRKFAGRRIDVVIASATPALQFVIEHREGLLADTPIVFAAGSLQQQPLKSPLPGATGVLRDVSIAETLELALRLHPSTRRVFVVAEAPTVEGYDERVRQALQPFAGQVEIAYVREQTVAGLLSAIKALPAESVILYTRFAPQNAEGAPNPVVIARLLAEVSPVPIYGGSDLYLGTGVVGGMVRATRATGTRLGEITGQILHGARPDDIPVEMLQVTPAFDWRQVQRWGIDPALLPVGSDIQFRTPTAWEAYRVYIIGALALLVTQTALITGLLVQRRHRRRAEGELRENEAALRQSYERNRDLGARLLQAKEAEHARIARELHDDICQRMLLLTIELESLGRAKPGRASAAGALKVAQEIATSLHDLSHRLHPTRLRLIGLVAALDRLCLETSRTGIAVAFTHENVPAPLPPELMLCLFRVVQEALQNAIKYSNARHVSVHLSGGPDGLVLAIRDDGVGFDVSAAWGKGVGLVSMVERLEAIGGTLDVRSTAVGGTHLTATVPVLVMQNTQSPALMTPQPQRTH